MKTYGHMSSRDKKSKQEAIGMRAGLRNNEFCLCGLRPYPRLVGGTEIYGDCTDFQ